MSSQTTKTMETWKPVVGFEGSYEVSDMGRVRSLDRVVMRSNGRQQRWTGKLLRLINHNDYFKVSLSMAGKGAVHHLVHRLVLQAFVEPCPDGMEGCHNDGDPGNNDLSNLRWDTRKNNGADTVIHGTSNRGERQWKSKLNQDQVLFIKGQLVEGTYTHHEIANWFGVHRNTISAISAGENWSWL